MKVIVAGFLKTGTKSMRAALTELGYNVYDYMENFDYLGDEWTRILIEGGNTEDFRRMFENVDAVTDIPGCYFWDEIHKAFPDAKIILTTRKNEDEWSRSFKKQIEVLETQQLYLPLFYAPTAQKLYDFSELLWRAVFGFNVKHRILRGPKYSMTLAKMTYRRHNSHVLQTAPKDKLLVYNVKEGWEPLCKFLNVDVPDKPFPHKNIGGDVLGEIMNSPAIKQGTKEYIVSRCFLFITFVGLIFGAYKLFTESYSSLLW